MSRLEQPWSTACGPYPLTKSFTIPRMAPSAPNRVHAYHPSASKYSPWGSEFTRDGTTKEWTSSKGDRAAQHKVVSKQPKGTCSRFWSSLTELFPGSSQKREKKLNTLTFPFVPHDRWKAYGYFPCPITNRVQVRNSTPRRPSLVTIHPYHTQGSLHSTTNVPQHPSYWTGRAQQPTLQPTLQDWVRVARPLALGVQLDPHLQHRCNGPHPIDFDIALGPNSITHNARDSVAMLPLDHTYFTRLASHPPVTYMRIECVADDPLPHFPWPIEIRKARGITCGDVFQAISRHFLEYVSEHEYNGWTARRKKIAARAYYARVGTPRDPAIRGEVTGPDDGLRRIDYVGERVMFRGLEQAAAMMENTWLMYLGGERTKVSCHGADLVNSML